MSNREYRENQKKQRKEFKKYRKSMWKMFIGFLVAGAAAFVLPEFGLPALNALLKGIIGEYLAGSVTVFTQIALLAGGVIGGVVNAFKAIRAKDEIDKAQDEEENIVDVLINENEDLAKKVEKHEKEKTNVKVETKTNSKTMNYQKSNDSYVEEEEEKRYTK